VRSHWVYHPAEDRWDDAAPLPTPRGDLAAAAWEGQLYTFGGRRRGWLRLKPSDLVEVYDPASGRWFGAGHRLPEARSGLGAAAGVAGIHLVGGRGPGPFFGLGSRLTAEHWLYSPRLGRFRQLAPLPSPRQRVALAVHYDQVFALGGSAALGAVDDHERYDPSQNSWRPQPPLHRPVDGIGAAVWHDWLHVVGPPGSSGPMWERRRAATSFRLFERQAPPARPPESRYQASPGAPPAEEAPSLPFELGDFDLGG
jgi:hypothetical protein